MTGFISTHTELIITILVFAMATAVQFGPWVGKRWPYRAMYLRIMAGTIIGLPVAAYILVSGRPWSDYGFAFTNPLDTLLLATAFSALVMLGSWVASRRAADPLAYSPFPPGEWSTPLLNRSMVSWVVYLLPYEFVLRGFFLFYTLTIMPVFWAVALNVALYALAHLPKNFRETVLSLPFGILLCLLTLHTGNIWSAVAVHLALALTNDYLMWHVATRSRGAAAKQPSAE